MIFIKKIYVFMYLLQNIDALVTFLPFKTKKGENYF